eukprot:GILK01007117.1.p1 GENE.GILK01007117.1~~GILK01007117.1.p1  ORF type:complete len:398 (-),score=26.58 GILK01007117.1:174-1337(-)
MALSNPILFALAAGTIFFLLFLSSSNTTSPPVEKSTVAPPPVVQSYVYAPLADTDTSTESPELFEGLSNALRNLSRRDSRFFLQDYELFSLVSSEYKNAGALKAFAHPLYSSNPLIPPASFADPHTPYNIPKTPAPAVHDSRPLSLNDVVLVVMGSTTGGYDARTKTLWKTWLKWFPIENIFIFADQENSDMHTMTLPELKGRTSYLDAAHRQSRGMKWMVENHLDFVKSKKWFILLDDDTFLNVPYMLQYLDSWNHKLPIGFGYIWGCESDACEYQYFMGCNIILSQTSFIEMGKRMYTEECRFREHNDWTWGYCYHRAGVLQIHTTRIWPFQYKTGWGDWFERDIVQILATHYIKPDTMEKMTCAVAKAYAWPHPNCPLPEVGKK